MMMNILINLNRTGLLWLILSKAYGLNQDLIIEQSSK
jgi:hypothetical protein